MATVYSLICWGGRTGKTVSISATADVVTSTNHGLRNGHKLWPSGTLPAELNTSTPVYARSTAANTFTLHTSASDAIANTGQITFAGSSTYAAVVLKSDLIASTSHSALAPYGLSDLSRWGSSGSERIYDGLVAWNSARSGASEYDEEVCEIGDAFTDISASSLSINIPSAKSTAITKIAGIYSDAFHAGVYTAGYTFRSGTGGLTLSTGDEVDSFSLETTSASGTLLSLMGIGSSANAMIVKGNGSAGGTGVIVGQAVVNLTNSIIVNANFGVQINTLTYSAVIANNIIAKCGTGLQATSTANRYGYYYNNISVGNTLNYSPEPLNVERASNNFGQSGDANAPWAVGSGVTKLISTTDFVDYTNNDFRPASLTSPQVEAGASYLGVVTTDISGDFRPNYIGATNETEVAAGSLVAGFYYTIVSVGTTDFTAVGAASNTVGVSFIATGIGAGTGTATPSAKHDAGPYEFDHGYGPWPTTEERGLAFTGLIAGSTLKVFETGTTTELFSDTNTATSETWSENASGSRTVDYTILKDGSIPIRVTGITVTGAVSGGVLTTPIQQKESRAYQTSSGLTYGTTATINTGTKEFSASVATTMQNFYSFCCEAWRTEAALKNVAFPIVENGPNSFQLSDDWVFTSGSIQYLSRDGMRTVNSSGTVTGVWAAILSVGVPAGMQVRYQQQDGSGTTNAANTGNMDQLVKVYENGAYDYTGHLILKVQADGYDQAEFDLVGTFGTLEDQFYVAGLAPVVNGIAAGTVTGVTIADHGASPVTWNSKVFSITITDTTGHTGEQIQQYVRGLNNFNYHDLVQTNGTEFKTVRGKLYGDTGATLKGVRVVQADGTTSHTDFNLHTSDDGTTYVPPLPPAAAEATILASSRVQLYNVTTATEIENVFVAGTSYSFVITTEASAGDTLRLRVCKLGRVSAESFAVWSASGATFIISQPEETIYTAWGIDGSTVTEFSLDGANLQIDANDVDGSTTKTRLGAFYNYALTTEIGIRDFFGAVTFLSTAAIRVNTDVTDMFIDNINAATALRFTDLDVRLYKSDGTSIIAPTSHSIHNDYSGVPDVVETGVSGLTTAESNALMGLPGPISLLEKINRNKMVTDPVAGTLTVFDDDNTTPLLTADLFKDAAGTTPYNGTGAERRERLA